MFSHTNDEGEFAVCPPRCYQEEREGAEWYQAWGDAAGAGEGKSDHFRACQPRGTSPGAVFFLMERGLLMRERPWTLIVMFTEIYFKELRGRTGQQDGWRKLLKRPECEHSEE